MSRTNPSQQYKSFIIIADIPIFVIVGTIIGYYFFGGNNTESAVGALIGAIIFFMLSLIPVFQLALKEHSKDMRSISKKRMKKKKNSERTKNTLFLSQELEE